MEEKKNYKNTNKSNNNTRNITESGTCYSFIPFSVEKNFAVSFLLSLDLIIFGVCKIKFTANKEIFVFAVFLFLFVLVEECFERPTQAYELQQINKWLVTILNSK